MRLRDLVIATVLAVAGCSGKGDALVVVRATASTPLADVASLHTSATVGVTTREFDVPLGGGTPVSIPPDVSFGIVVPLSLGSSASLRLEARDVNGAALAAASDSVNIRGGARSDITLDLSAMGNPPDDLALGGGGDMAIGPCSNGVKDGLETDVDCGGSACAPCAVDKACVAPSDCTTRSCVGSVCALVSGPPSWLRLADLPTAREALTAATHIDGKIYAMGGQITSASCGTPGICPVTTVERYTPETNTWANGPALSSARWDFAAVEGPFGQIYVLGGELMGGAVITTVEQLDLAGTSWGSAPALPTAQRAFGAAFGSDSRIYTAGSSPTSGTVYVYSTANGWTTGPSLMSPRYYGAVAADASGKIYMIAGNDNTGCLASVEALTPGTTSWTLKKPVPTGVAYLGAAGAPDGRVYAVGGSVCPSSTVSNKVYAYSPALDVWTAMPALGVSRSNLAVTVGSDGRIYAIGGNSGTAALPAVEAYGPAITLSPAMGAAGSSVTLSGSNFAASANVAVYFGSATTPIATGTTTAAGALTAPITFTVPTVATGPYRVAAVDDRSQYRVSAPFTVQ